MITAFLNFNAIRACTQIARTQTYESVADPVKPKLRAIERAFTQGDFGCQTASVKALVEAIIGKPLPEPIDPRPAFVVGSLVVYAGDTYLVVRVDSDGDAYVMTSAGRTGLCTGTTSYISRGHSWEPASEDEVEVFIEQASRAAL